MGDCFCCLIWLSSHRSLRLCVLSEVALKLLRWMKHLLPAQKSIFSWFWTARFPLSRNQLAMKLHELDVEYESKHTWKAFDAFCVFPNLGSTNNGIQWLEIVWQVCSRLMLGHYAMQPTFYFHQRQAKVLKSDLASEFDVECYCQIACKRIQTVIIQKKSKPIDNSAVQLESFISRICGEKLPGPWLWQAHMDGDATKKLWVPKNLVLQAFAVSSLSLLALQIRLATDR